MSLLVLAHSLPNAPYARAQGLQSQRELDEARQAAAAAEPSKITILTPSVTNRIFVVDNDEFSIATLGLSSASKMSRSDRLSAQADRLGFEPTAVMARHLVEALRAAGLNPELVEIARPQHSGAAAGTLSRDRFPFEQAAGSRYVLDVTVKDLGLRQSEVLMFGFLYPAAYARYRIFDAQGAIVQPPTPVLLNIPGPRQPSGFAGEEAYAQTPKEALKPDPACKFRTTIRKEAAEDRLWSCLDGALKQLAVAIADDPLLRRP